MRNGLTQRRQAAVAKRKRGKAEAALIAVDPRTGEILAFVGGRSYNQSQYNRAIAVAAPAGFGLQAVRVPHRVRAGARRRDAPTSRRPRSRSTSRRRSSSTIRCGRRRTTSSTYDGPITFRHALAHSRNLGDDPRRAAGRLRPRGGALEEARRRQSRRRPIRRSRSASSKRRRYEIATAYTLFPNGGIDPAAASTSCRSRAAARTSPRRTPRSRSRSSRGRRRRSSSRT